MYLHLVADNSGKYVRRMFCKLYSIHIRMHCVDKCHHKYIRIYEPYVTQIQIYRKKKDMLTLTLSENSIDILISHIFLS